MRFALLGLLVACGFTIAWLVLRGEAARDEPVTPTVASEAVGEQLPIEVREMDTDPLLATDRDAPRAASEPAAALPPEAAPQGEVPGSIGAFASGFYGAEWEQLRDELAQRIDLSAKPDIPIPAWGSVLDDLRKAMRIREVIYRGWLLRFAPPSPMTLAYLHASYPNAETELDERDLKALEAMVVDHRSEVETLLQQLRSVCDAILASKFQLGQYDYGPFSNLRSHHAPRSAFYNDSTGIRGWSVAWSIAESEDPEIARVLGELGQLRGRIAAIIRGYLDKK